MKRHFLFSLVALATVDVAAAGEFEITAVEGASFHRPWGLAFTGSGDDALISERNGALSLFSKGVKTPIADAFPGAIIDEKSAVPFEIMLDDQTLYACYAMHDEGGPATVVAQASMSADFQSASGWRVLAKQKALPFDPMHFWGCRLANMGFGIVGASFGARVRDNSSTIGGIFIIGADGLAREFASGFRNPQGLAFANGKLFASDHGPNGGDEINLVYSLDYGWPRVTYGVGYDGAPGMGNPLAPPPVEGDGTEKPIWTWTPSIGPLGMSYCACKAFPRWSEALLVGGGASHALHIMRLHGSDVVGEVRLSIDDKRIRLARETPNGEILVLPDEDGPLYRIKAVTPSGKGRW